MRQRILFVERRSSDFSIENVFRQVAKKLSAGRFETAFQTLTYGNDLVSIFKNLFLFRKQPADIYHITGQIHHLALRLPAERTVLTIHDLRFLRTKRRLRRFIIKKLFLDWPVQKLRYITAVSQTTKDEIILNTGCDPAKIRVIENPVFDEFCFREAKTFNDKCPIILQIGYTENKNIPRLIEAIDGVPCRLLIVGRLDSDLKLLLTKSGVDFEIRQDLTPRELAGVYHESDLVAFCSTYEGFGLPIIEAQAMGKPVVTSDLSPMKEISAAAAVLVDPYDVSSIRAGILKIIEDERLRAKLIAEGRENAKRFDSNITAKSYADLYAEILDTRI